MSYKKLPFYHRDTNKSNKMFTVQSVPYPIKLTDLVNLSYWYRLHAWRFDWLGNQPDYKKLELHMLDVNKPTSCRILCPYKVEFNEIS